MLDKNKLYRAHKQVRFKLCELRCSHSVFCRNVFPKNFSSSCRRLRAVFKRPEVPFRLLTILNQFQFYFSACIPMLFRIIIHLSDNYPDNYPSPEEISSG